MNAKPWTAIGTETKSFLEVEYCDDTPQMEPLRRYRSEPDLATCQRYSNGTCKSKCITMVNQFAAMPKNLDEDEVSSNGFKSQNIPRMAEHLREFEDEEIALLGNDPVPMEHSNGACKSITMVCQFVAMPQSLADDEVSINRFKSQHISKMAEWHFREFEDEEMALFGIDPVPMENQLKGLQPPCKKGRPCKGQRMRYKKFTEKMMFSLRNDPDGFELDEASLPPSLAASIERKARLVTYLQAEKQRILKDREVERILAPLLVGLRQ